MAPLAFALLIALAGDCSEWRQCREMALAAAERGEYETFHDLAWRAIQTGNPKDPSLMYLLARAQALSGRPHDALVMLLRLAEMGVVTDASTSDDFARTRQLPGWPEAEARISALTRRDPSPAVAAAPPRTRPEPPPPAPAAAALPTPPPPVRLAPAGEGLRFSTREFPVSGLAYDSLSSRFVLGDRRERKLVEVDERSKKTIDLVRADSAGFLAIAAVEIDGKRGDLWVLSGDEDGGAGTLHKLQLASGRPLRAFQVAANMQPAKLVDLTIGPSGALFVLDALTPRVFVLRARATSLEPVTNVDAEEPTSVAVGSDEQVLFVAHRGGIAKVDLRSHTTSAVAAPGGVSLRGVERLRWHGNALIAVQRQDDGSRRVLRLELNAKGTAIAQATNLEVATPATPATGQIAVTISGDDLLYLTAEPADPSPEGTSRPREFTAYRFPLR